MLPHWPHKEHKQQVHRIHHCIEEDIVEDVANYILVPPVWEFTGDIFIGPRPHEELLSWTAGPPIFWTLWFL